MEYRQLIEIAYEVRENSYAPYSGFKSGAVLVTAEGEVYTGCSMEIASFSSSVCAGQAAFVNAISNGEKNFSVLVLVGGNDDEDFDYCPPSGACRQIIQEFCSSDFIIVLAKSVQEFVIYSFEDLFPVPFSKKQILG